MNILSRSTNILINISVLSFGFLNVYIFYIYDKLGFILEKGSLSKYISILVSAVFAISTLCLIYKMIVFAAGEKKIDIQKIPADVQKKFINFYNQKNVVIICLMLFLYCFFLYFFKNNDLYFNLNIYTMISIVLIFGLTLFFLVINHKKTLS
ncbi:hypothetical protein [Neisseria montereyensis]|uniref:Integral membrane protein n=1 Tax=Neisseria montereyensis TaxID=2973938 RepID=A0ABT2FDJ4_9NEIS|nr:hypothetical protein [Neisseria montereyensis]MCS4534291.1 hypothetical protein [Neisseria montereyensis]